MKDLESSPRGVLRVATPLLFGQSFLASVAAALRVVYPSNRHLSQRVRLFVDMLVAEFRKRGDDHGLVVQQRLSEKNSRGRIAGRIPSCSTLR
ncbi:hypothetical protein ACSRUE_14450 [Sorangium sp. KYC3313]|uniref:hypothetical protein n=1 Tax=Sorangium sp. KYC3313 TaxID=3449740 RepID=UPI003F89FC3C